MFFHCPPILALFCSEVEISVCSRCLHFDTHVQACGMFLFVVTVSMMWCSVPTLPPKAIDHAGTHGSKRYAIPAGVRDALHDLGCMRVCTLVYECSLSLIGMLRGPCPFVGTTTPRPKDHSVATHHRRAQGDVHMHVGLLPAAAAFEGPVGHESSAPTLPSLLPWRGTSMPSRDCRRRAMLNKQATTAKFWRSGRIQSRPDSSRVPPVKRNSSSSAVHWSSESGSG